jgi:hypothetical protein
VTSSRHLHLVPSTPEPRGICRTTGCSAGLSGSLGFCDPCREDLIHRADRGRGELPLDDSFDAPRNRRSTRPRRGPSIASAEHHHQAPRDRGWHPHDEGHPITPPLVWTTQTPVQDVGRSVHVDLAAWHTLKRLPGVVDVAIALGKGGRWQGYQALPVDDARQRWAATVPEDPGADGWLPDAVYAVRILVTDTLGETHEWTPANAPVGDDPPESTLVTLTTPAAYVPVEVALVVA